MILCLSGLLMNSIVVGISKYLLVSVFASLFVYLVHPRLISKNVKTKGAEGVDIRSHKSIFEICFPLYLCGLTLPENSFYRRAFC